MKVVRFYYEWHLIQAEVPNRRGFFHPKSPGSSPTHHGIAAPSTAIPPYNPICIKLEKLFLT